MGHDAQAPAAGTENSSAFGTREIVWDGLRLDVAAWRLSGDVAVDDSALQSLPAREVVARARDASGPSQLRHLVIGVIGPREASDRQESTARNLGQALADLSVTTICGGRTGVMEAVCKGVSDAGGLSIGILPGFDPEDANPFVGIPLPTGLSEGRNMVIARAARVLIAVGGSHGTLTEMAYGLHFGKAVIALDDAPTIDGLTRVADVDAAVEACCAALLRQAGHRAGKQNGAS